MDTQRCPGGVETRGNIRRSYKQCGVLQNHAKSGDSFSHCEFCHPILLRKAMGVTLSEENCLVVCVGGKGLEGQ